MDDILLEMRKIREAYAENLGFDLQAIHRDLKEQQRAGGRRIVSLPPRRSKPAMANGENARPMKASGETS